MQSSTYPSTISCFQQIIREEGLNSLFRGATSILVTTPLRSAVSIPLYSWLKNKHMFKHNFTQGFVSGWITGGLLSLAACPIERIKCVMQVSNYYKSSAECASHLYSTIGVLGIYRGLTITILRDSLGFGVFFGAYEEVKRLILEKHQKFTWWGWLMCGSFSGVMCWVAILPFDCIKTRFQLAEKKESYSVIMKEIIRTTGVRGLWAGFNSCVVRAIISNGIGFFCYELVKHNIPKYVLP